MIKATKDEINLGVSSTYETITNVTTKVNNAIINASDDATSKADKARDEAIDHTNTVILNYYTKEETNAQIDITKKSIESTVSETIIKITINN